ncbi:MAG: hypothetical protein CVV07_08050 [Gammaproteobacteria bacterium HGW-Gammaproteobacteria-11]|nr:MAG: hypothetical protein CVV07_08050 [Gammaproteobacteria bacterium HGW-Gammaproteobacteria-11]
MSLRRLALSALLCAPLAMQSVEAETVLVDGAVNAPGNYQWQDGARLRDAALAGQVNADAWHLGAALLRQSAIEPQQRLKAGVLFDLRANQVHALARDDQSLAELLARLNQQVDAMPVTGRVVAQMSPYQQLLLANNPSLEPGDSLLYPRRPDQVRVMGAVVADCELAFDAALQPRDYLRQCPQHDRADPSYLHVIQPDGVVQSVGVGYWNAESLSIAVGAVLYVPINPLHLSDDTPDLNKEMAAMLATQYPLGGRFDD